METERRYEEETDAGCLVEMEILCWKCKAPQVVISNLLQ